MNKKDLDFFKNKLLDEKTVLEQDLDSVARKSPGSPGGWEATTNNMEIDPADENELADKLEELEDNGGITDQLEKQLAEVKAALDKIETGKYGICESCGKPIEKERLEANPSAKISLKHGH